MNRITEAHIFVWRATTPAIQKCALRLFDSFNSETTKINFQFLSILHRHVNSMIIMNAMIIEPRYEKPDFFCIYEDKDADQLCGNRTVDQRLCFATQIVQCLNLLNPKFQASCSLLWLCSPVYVRPGQKPRRPVFSQ